MTKRIHFTQYSANVTLAPNACLVSSMTRQNVLDLCHCLFTICNHELIVQLHVLRLLTFIYRVKGKLMSLCVDPNHN